MEKVIHDEHANDDKENDSKLHQNEYSSGKSLTLRSYFWRLSQVSFSYLFFDFEFRLCLVLS